MKANIAPEKIYVDSKAIGGDISTTIHTKRQDYPTCIEYIRADAFIEKACNAYCSVCDTPNCRAVFSHCPWLDKFKEELSNRL